MATKQLMPNQCTPLHFIYGPSDCCLCAARNELVRAKAEIMEKIRAAEDAYFEKTYGADVDKSLCQPAFFAPCEIEAIIYDLPMPERV